MIIIDGITIKNQSHLSAAFEGIYANSIMDYNVLDNEKIKQDYKNLKGWNGAILIILDNKGHRRFSKNIKQFEKRLTNNNAKLY